jgi:hypothetical protein
MRRQHAQANNRSLRSLALSFKKSSIGLVHIPIDSEPLNHATLHFAITFATDLVVHLNG